jgi:hypothetical protein
LLNYWVVSKQFAGLGFGRFIILKSIEKMYADTPQQAGCLFITVDACNLVKKSHFFC